MILGHGLGHNGHGGGGGGHHGGGGGYHHGGGVYYGGGYNRSPYLYPPPEVIVVESKPSCPDTWAPVLASDGRVYRNACIAQRAGVGIVRSAKAGEIAKGPVLGRLGALGALGALTPASVTAAAVAVGLTIAALAYGSVRQQHDRRRR